MGFGEGRVYADLTPPYLERLFPIDPQLMEKHIKADRKINNESKEIMGKKERTVTTITTLIIEVQETVDSKKTRRTRNYSRNTTTTSIEG